MKKTMFILLLSFVLSSCVPYIHYTPIMEEDCVDRAVKIKQELQIKGYEARIVLGIRQEGNKKDGHAWVEYKDKQTGEWKRINNY